MMRLKLTVEYDGTDFYGFQRQPGLRTVDQVLEKAIQDLTGETVKVTGAGRTDAGVHALGQVVAFDSLSTIPAAKFARALNTFLPQDIHAIDSVQVEPDFHPSYSARSKTYRYMIYRSYEGYTMVRRYAHLYTGALNLEMMKAAASIMTGEHDFRSFMAQGSAVRQTVRNIMGFEVMEDYPWLRLEVTGTGFLYHMVRNMAGTLLEIGRGAMSVATLRSALETGDRSLVGPTAPARGLCLIQVHY
jgi:tRNA pseudouridine38-40 synthase